VGARSYIVYKSLVGVILEQFLGKSVDVLIEKKLKKINEICVYVY
jgi:hypothetical protein